MSNATICPKCNLPRFHGVVGYAGPQCTCQWSTAPLQQQHFDFEAMVERAMRARMPGGAAAWVWLFNCEGGQQPEEKHREWFRTVLSAALGQGIRK